MKKITVRILHNENERESFHHGYQDGDSLKEVYKGRRPLMHKTPESRTLSLEYIFEANQWVDDAHRPWYEARSLSVGDVIVLQRRAFACERVGFREIDPQVVS